MTRKRIPATERRSQLLDIALDIVATEGFGAVTVARLSQDAGVTRPLIYHQFGDLDGLLFALVQRETARATDGLASIRVPMSASASEGAAAGLSALFDEASALPLSWLVLLNPPDGGPPELHERIARGRSMAREQVAAFLTKVVSAGVIADLDMTAHFLHIMAEEAVRLYLRDPERFPRERVLPPIIDMVRKLTAHIEDPQCHTS